LLNWPRHSGLERVDAAILDADPAAERLPSLERMQLFDAVLEGQIAAD